MPIEIEAIFKVAAGVAGLIAALFAVRGLFRWLIPIQVNPGLRLHADPNKPDEVWASIVNKSKETQYITKCSARPTFPARSIIKRFLRKPFFNPKWVNVIRFSPQQYSLIGGEAKKIEPLEVVRFSHKLRLELPIDMFTAPMFLIEVELSSGEVVRSKAMSVPKQWLLKINGQTPNYEIA